MDKSSLQRLARRDRIALNALAASGHFRESKAPLRFADGGKSIKAWPNTEVKQLLLQFDPAITRHLRKFGIEEKINGTGFAIHHFDFPKEKAYFTDDASAATLKEIRAALRGHRDLERKLAKGEISQGEAANAPAELLYRQLAEEVRHIVLIPEWFHNEYHLPREDSAAWSGLHSREAYYRKMAELLREPNTYDEIAALRFDGSTLHSALKSLTTLALTVHKKNRKFALDSLRRQYENLKEKSIEYFKSHRC